MKKKRTITVKNIKTIETWIHPKLDWYFYIEEGQEDYSLCIPGKNGNNQRIFTKEQMKILGFKRKV